MGCSSSKNADPLLELAPVRPAQAGGQTERRMNRQEILDALALVAAALAKQRQSIRIVAVGGSVNTVVLRSRDATHDIDFLAENVSRQQGEVLLNATKRVGARFSPRLPNDWLNSRTTLFIDRAIRQQLEQESFRQKVVLFSAPGLTVYAAPWMYMFVSKLDRIAGGGAGLAQTYDPDDAYAYLNQHLRSVQSNNVSLQDIRQYLRHYRLDRIANQKLVRAARQINEIARMRNSRPLITGI